MQFDDLIRQIRAVDPGALPDDVAPAQARLVRATLRALAAAASQVKDEPLAVPVLGVFKRPPAAAKKAKPGVQKTKLVFFPRAPAEGAALPGPATVTPPVKAAPPAKAAAVPARADASPPKGLGRPGTWVDPGGRFVVLCSGRAASVPVLAWCLHQAGWAAEAQAWAGGERRAEQLRALRQRPELARAAEAPAAASLRVLRIVRDPFERAESAFRHLLATQYAHAELRAALGVELDLDGLSFDRYLDFLESEDLDRCDLRHARQRHPLEAQRPADLVLNVSRCDLLAGLNDFERLCGLPSTRFAGAAWLPARPEPLPVAAVADERPDRLVLTRQQALRGPWPQGLLTPAARERLARLYAADVAAYS